MAGTAGSGTIDVTRGGGEFGRGFYCHQKEARAWILVLNRYQQPAVLRLDIEDGLYNGLAIRNLSVQQARRLRQTIRSSADPNNYLVGPDVVVGPNEINPRVIQDKFETPASETVLNGSQTIREVLP
jgi:hypothetical protein